MDMLRLDRIGNLVDTLEIVIIIMAVSLINIVKSFLTE